MLDDYFRCTLSTVLTIPVTIPYFEPHNKIINIIPVTQYNPHNIMNNAIFWTTQHKYKYYSCYTIKLSQSFAVISWGALSINWCSITFITCGYAPNSFHPMRYLSRFLYLNRCKKKWTTIIFSYNPIILKKIDIVKTIFKIKHLLPKLCQSWIWNLKDPVRKCFLDHLYSY